MIIPKYVYRHLNDTGHVLYVGCTRNLLARHQAHRQRSPWWPLVARVTAEGPFPQLGANMYERALIAAIQPPHNVGGTDRDPRRTDPATECPVPWVPRSAPYTAHLSHLREAALDRINASLAPSSEQVFA